MQSEQSHLTHREGSSIQWRLFRTLAQNRKPGDASGQRRSAEIARRYEEHRQQFDMDAIRQRLWLAVALYILFALTDLLFIPDVAATTIIVRFVVGLIIVLTLEAAARGKSSRDVLDSICGASVVVGYAAWIVFAQATQHNQAFSYYMMFGAIFMMGTNIFFTYRFAIAFVSSALVLLFFFVSLFMIEHDTTYRLILSIFYVCCFVFTSYVSWSLDLERYHVFLNALEAQRQQAVATQALTEREQAVAEREAALNSRDAASKAKVRFLGMVTHELRSPLQAIVSALDVIESGGSGAGRRVQAGEDTAQIRRATNSLTVLLRDMLTIARGEVGRIEIRPEEFEASELVLTVAEALRPAAEAKGLILHINTPDDPIFVVADAGRIEQILRNLVDNAVHYTSTGDVIVTLSALQHPDSALRFSVADTGPGMPTELLTQPYNIVDAEDGGRHSIGLAVVQTLAHEMGGMIEVNSSGQGTSITITVPVIAMEPGAGLIEERPSRVLVIDDQENLARGLSRVCEALGVPCDIAITPTQAMNRLRASQYSVVLIDLDMPEVSGLDLADQIRKQALRKGARLIAMSAAATGNPADIKALFDAEVEKPIGQDKLLKLLTTKPAA